jgi:hypothetical protein
LRGLSFREHFALVIILLGRAYRSLTVNSDIDTYARVVAGSLHTDAEPLPEGDHACFPCPRFHFNKLRDMTTFEVVRKPEDNRLIIQEIPAVRSGFMKKRWARFIGNRPENAKGGRSC